MRIEAYNQIAGLYKTSKTTKTYNNYGVISKDEVQISQTGRDFQIAKQAVAQSTNVREDRVAQLKAKIESGEYQISADDFASKLMDRYEKIKQYL